MRNTIRRTLIRQQTALLLLLYAALAVNPLPAFASEVPEEAARAQFAKGIGLVEQSRYSEALSAFEQSYRLNPHPVVLFNLGMCQKVLEQHMEALVSFRLLLDRFADEIDPKQKQAAQQAIEELKGKVAALVLLEIPPGAVIVLDGEEAIAEQGEVHLELNPGSHSLIVKAEVGTYLHETLLLTLGEKRTMNLSVLKRKAIVKISANAPDAAIRVDGVMTGLAPFSEPMNPGLRELRVTAPGFAEHAEILELRAGEHIEMEIELQPIQAENVSVEPSPSRRSRRILGWTSLGLALVSGSIGGYFTYSAAGHADNIDALDEQIDDANGLDFDEYESLTGERQEEYDALRRSMIGQWVGYGVGAALAVTGTVLLVRNRDSTESLPPHGPEVALSLQPNRIGLAISF